MANAEECSGCGATNASMKKCSRCKTVKYCDRQCQVKDIFIWTY